MVSKLIVVLIRYGAKKFRKSVCDMKTKLLTLPVVLFVEA